MFRTICSDSPRGFCVVYGITVWASVHLPLSIWVSISLFFSLSLLYNFVLLGKHYVLSIVPRSEGARSSAAINIIVAVIVIFTEKKILFSWTSSIEVKQHLHCAHSYTTLLIG